jgi:hypothetical protein
MTRAMVQAHAKGLGRKHQHTGVESFSLTTMNDQRGSIYSAHARVVELFTAMHNSNGKVQPPINPLFNQSYRSLNLIIRPSQESNGG